MNKTMFPDPKHNMILRKYIFCDEYERFSSLVEDMEWMGFIDGHIVTEAGDDMIELIIYKEVK